MIKDKGHQSTYMTHAMKLEKKNLQRICERPISDAMNQQKTVESI